MERISVFDIFKIGIGPSSSHTTGPWRAARLFLKSCRKAGVFEQITKVEVLLYGSLAKTGKGHGTDIAVICGLSDYDPVTIPPAEVTDCAARVRETEKLFLGGEKEIRFVPKTDIIFLFKESLEFHANALTFRAISEHHILTEKTYYSVGGGFVTEEYEEEEPSEIPNLPRPIECAEDLRGYCRETGLPISQIVFENELYWRTEEEIRSGTAEIRRVMMQSIFDGCRKEGKLPGGLNVERRARKIALNLLGTLDFPGPDEWFAAIRATNPSFKQILKWISCFAMAVNEENAAFGRVVTAPTNGAAGVIPAVMAYHICFGEDYNPADDFKFMLTASEIGSIFKKGATISAAMGGCQAEIGVSSAMAAAALTECSGGTPEQAAMAAEIAMEHHLGLTCDPIGGLVQIPCIERNTMGAIKAVTAAQIALESDPAAAKVTLDNVVKTMWETARDMNSKYKETSDGGLALHISVVLPEC